MGKGMYFISREPKISEDYRELPYAYRKYAPVKVKMNISLRNTRSILGVISSK